MCIYRDKDCVSRIGFYKVLIDKIKIYKKQYTRILLYEISYDLQMFKWTECDIYSNESRLRMRIHNSVN